MLNLIKYARSRLSMLDLFHSSWLQVQIEFEVTIRKITGSTKLKCLEFSRDLAKQRNSNLKKTGFIINKIY